MALDSSLIIVFLGVLISLIVAGAALYGPGARARKRLRQRAAGLTRNAGGDLTASLGAGILKQDSISRMPMVDQIIRRVLPRPDELRRRLARTGRSISFGAYAALGCITALAIGGAMSLIASAPPFAAGAAGLAGGLAIPHITVGWLGSRRIGRFNRLFPDAIDLIVRGLRSGLPISETIAAVGREMADPIGAEFRAVADAVRLGESLEDSLWEATARLDTPEFKFFVISLAIQKETGGNLAETLENLSDILRRRGQMRLKIRAMSSEARASAMILGSLPFIMFGVIYLINPDYEQQLLVDPRGKMMLAAAAGIMSTGIAVMHKMVRFEI